MIRAIGPSSSSRLVMEVKPLVSLMGRFSFQYAGFSECRVLTAIHNTKPISLAVTRNSPGSKSCSQEGSGWNRPSRVFDGTVVDGWSETLKPNCCQQLCGGRGFHCHPLIVWGKAYVQRVPGCNRIKAKSPSQW